MPDHESQQKALFLLAKCGDFAVGSTSIPAPGPGELLIKNGAIALNPVDWKIQKYGFAVETFPAIIGLDLAGIVEAVGEGVIGFRKGDRVVASPTLRPRQGAFQQYTIAWAKYTAKVPQSVSIEQAASVPAGIITAAVGLYQAEQAGAGLTAPWEQDGQDKYNNRPILVLGGASSVGAYVIQLAKLSGFSPIIATASPRNTAYLESLGATNVLDRHLDADALKKEVASIIKLPFDVIYDAISEPDTQKLGYELLADNGTLVLTLPSGLGETTSGKKVKSTLGSPFPPGNEQVGEGLYASLHGYLDTGAIQPNRVEILAGGLGGIVTGLDRLREGKVSGVKLVVRPQETD
ncbi:GroES-like protein [Athelia psychrophila]|uniref:GroES-like protein n=1 Tax=Athelia psychrophila TaxID=1759441 RepID=A0A167XT18_9AGAM|nr:GroES-like protein [Fibularhizoctonia sp. CBS 109695]